MERIPKPLKKILILINILVVLTFLGFGIKNFFDLVVVYKAATNNDYIAFFGSVVGSLLGAVISFSILLITIRHNDKNHRKLANLQNALREESNLNEQFSIVSTAISELMGNLDSLLLFVQTVKPSEKTYSSDRNKLFTLYTNFRQSIHNVRYKTNFYAHSPLCEGCTLCDITIFGDLVKAKSIAVNKLFEIDGLCTECVYSFFVALDAAIDSNYKIERISLLNALLLSNEKSMTEIQRQISVNQNNPIQLSLLNEDLKLYKKDYDEKKKELEAVNKQKEELASKMGEKNRLARDSAGKILLEHKPRLDEFVLNYFNLYKTYVRKSFEFTENNGRISKECRKVSV